MAGAGAGAGAEIWSKSELKPKINNFGSAKLVFCADILIIFCHSVHCTDVTDVILLRGPNKQ